MDLNKLYKEIEEAEVNLNAKRLGNYIPKIIVYDIQRIYAGERL